MKSELESMKNKLYEIKNLKAVILGLILVFTGFFIFKTMNKPQEQVSRSAALTVEYAISKRQDWPELVKASGSIEPWEEAIIGSEISGERLVEVSVNIGDRVKKGQILARFNNDRIEKEIAELQSSYKKAESDLNSAIILSKTGTLSKHDADKYKNQSEVAKARLEAKNLQLSYTDVLAPEDGTISKRNATLGSIGTAGGELFRLILDNRIEWRGELNASQLKKVAVGQKVELSLPDDSKAKATIRQLAPHIDPLSRLGIIYADIESGSSALAGMYAKGSIEIKTKAAIIVPAVSVVIRDGRSYVFTLLDDNQKVTQKKVTTGEYIGSYVEIIDGLEENVRVVTQGAGFLNNGDIVSVIENKGDA